MNTQNQQGISRRATLKSLASGFGYLAFAALANEAAAHAKPDPDDPLAPKQTHFPEKAKRVIFLCMNGGPSHVDLLDYKPLLNDQAQRGKAKSALKANKFLMGSPFKFAQHGESGLWLSELWPELSKHADQLCVINSMHTDLPNHASAFIQMHTGSFQFTRPSVGAWSLYGLGTLNKNLPGFITLNPPSENGGARNYGSAFLPAVYQATKIGTNQIPEFYAKLLGVDEEPGPPVRHMRNEQLTPELQRQQLDLIRDLNGYKLAPGSIPSRD